MTPARARELILHVFVDKHTITPEILREIRKVQKGFGEYESEALFRVADIPYPGTAVVKDNRESIRLMVSAAHAAAIVGVSDDEA